MSAKFWMEKGLFAGGGEEGPLLRLRHLKKEEINFGQTVKWKERGCEKNVDHG